jgi:TonB family protein
MMNLLSKLLFISGTSLAMGSSYAVQDAQTQPHINVETETQIEPVAVHEPSTVLLESTKLPEPIKRATPKYPTSMARKGAEGWVQLNFVVNTEGKVENIVVVDSSGMQAFENAAIKAIEHWEYSPAYVDGKPVEQCHNNVQMDFRLQGIEKRVRRKFKNNYESVREALNSNDIGLARELFDGMKNKGLLNSIEFSFFSLLGADLTKAEKDRLAELDYVKSILFTDDSGEYLGEEAHRILLNRLFVLQLQQSKYLDLLDTFQRIETQNNNQENIAALRPYANKVIDLLKSKQVILISGTVKQDGDWWHPLSRRAFSLKEVDGTLDTVELRCHNKRELYTATTDSTWNIPASWGRCSVRVVGDSGSQFTLLEIPRQSEQS